MDFYLDSGGRWHPEGYYQPVTVPYQPYYPPVYPTVRSPFKCPVCDGKGKVRAGFYSLTTDQETCKSCSGTGVVWG